MAGLLSWLGNEAHKVRDIFDANTVEDQRKRLAAGQPRYYQQQQAQQAQNPAAPSVVSRVVHDVTHNPVTNLPQTINNDIFKPIQRDVIKPVSNLPQTFGNDVLAPLNRNVVQKVPNIPLGGGAKLGDFGRELPDATVKVFSPLARSAVGTGQAFSGLYDLATPGTGTSRVSKALDTEAKLLDQSAKQLNVNPVYYHGGQAVGDAAQFLTGAGEAKLAARTLSELPKVGRVVRPIASVAPKINARVANATEDLLNSGVKGRIAAKTIRGAANPNLLAGNIGTQAFYTGQQASRGQDINPALLAATTAAFQVGAPLVGAAGMEVARPVIKGTSVAVKAGTQKAKVANQTLSGRIGIQDQAALKAYSNYLAGATRETGKDLSKTIADARNVAQKYGYDVTSGPAATRLENVNKILDQIGQKRNQGQGGYIKNPLGGKGPESSPRPLQSTTQKGVPRTGQGGVNTSLDRIVSPEDRVFAQNPLAVENQPGFILKQGPVVGGKRDVIVARRNPETGHLEAHQESRMISNTTPGYPANQKRTLRASDPQSRNLEPASSPGGRLNPNGRNMDATSLRIENSSNPTLSARHKNADHQSMSSPRDIQTSSFDNNITQSSENGHPSYPIEKKVSILDYARTPEKVLNKVGLKNEAQGLLRADRQYKQTLPKEIDKVSKWYDEVGRSPESSQRIFQRLDGQKVSLNPTETKVAGEIKTYLKGWADRLGLPEDKRLSNYITHIFDKELVGKEFDPDLEKIIADKTTKSVYDPFTQQRLGAKGYKEDVFAALDAYVKRGTRKEAFDPALAKLEAASQDLDLSGQKFVKHYTDAINMRPSEFDNLLDNMIKQSPVGYKFGQRPVTALSRKIRQATFRAALGGNVGSAVRNLTQGINTFAELGTKWTGVGYTKAAHAIATRSDELAKTGVLDNSFIEDRTVSATKKALQRMDKGLFALFEAAEKINRGAAYYGAKSKALAAGKSEAEAVKQGVETARKTQFTFGRVDTPVALQNDLVKLVTQFQSYNVKQVEFLAGMVKNKEFAKLLRLAGASTAVYLTAGKALGYQPQDMIPFGSNFANGDSPFAGTPAFKLAGDVKNVGDKIINGKDNKTSTKKEQITKKVQKLGSDIGSGFIPGFVQGKKTVTGIQAVKRGQVQKGSTKYTLNQNKGQYVKGAVFGPYSLNGPKSTPPVTIKNGEKDMKLSPKQSDAFNKTNTAKYDELATRLKSTASYKNATPEKQKMMLTSLKSTTTSANKRIYSANNNIPLDKQAAKAEQAVIEGQLPKTKSSKSGSSTDINKKIDAHSQHILREYDNLDAATRDKKVHSETDYEYKVALAKYENDKANGKLTDAENIKRSKSLAKAQVGKVYPKDVRDLYSLSKTDLYNYLINPEKGKDKQKMSKQLEAYDTALYNAGLISYRKFKTGIAPSKGGRSGGGSSGTSAAEKQFVAQLKYNAAIPAPTLPKFNAPKIARYKAPALRKTGPAKSLNNKGNFKVTIRKGLV